MTVFTGHPNYPEGQIYPVFKQNPHDFASFEGARVVRVPILPRGKGSLRLVLNYLSFIVSGLSLGGWHLRHLEVDAIFVFQTSPITSALPAQLFRWLKRAPLLMWVLDLWPESISAVGAVKSRYALKWVGYLVSFIYHRCDRILVQSRAFLLNIAQYGGDPERVRYFPGWAEPIFLGHLEETPLAPELAPYQGTFNVLYAGNLGDAQDFPAVLDAAESLKHRLDIRWLLLGDGRAASWIRAEIQRRNLGSTVILLGRQPIERMPSFFRGAQALLVSLKKDPIFALTIPGKVQSYLAAGLPLVGMLDGEGARVITEAGAGLVCPAGEGKELAARILTLADMSQTERSDMGARGRKYSEKHFDRATLIGNLETWMAEAVRNSRKVRA